MANDILSAASGAASGNQTTGRPTVATGSRGANFSQTLDGTVNKKTIAIADIAADYDARFDDPRYYTGDTAS
jgi:hypothetical protein